MSAPVAFAKPAGLYHLSCLSCNASIVSNFKPQSFPDFLSSLSRMDLNIVIEEILQNEE